jgi:hypothetical protein
MELKMPTYKIVYDFTFIHGTPYRAGAEIEHRGWPGGPGISAAGAPAGALLDPIDDAAKRITAYWNAHRVDPGLPNSPMDRAGRFYLPAHLRGMRGRNFPNAVAPEEVVAGMPAYTSTIDQVLDWNDRTEEIPRGAMFGRRAIAPGTKIYFLAWPEPEFGLEAANKTAKVVVEYFERGRGRSDLPPAPWNLFDDELYLPKLEALEPERRVTFSSPPFDRNTERALLKMDVSRPANPFAGR